MTDRSKEAGEQFGELVRIMAKLRSPGGCPWDQKRTFDTIKSYLLEETYEVMDAIDARDFEGLQEELGDLLLQPVFFAQMAKDEGRFDVVDSLEAINQKLIRRHPHVFADAVAHTPEDVKHRWEEIKRQEKAGQGIAPAHSALDAVPRSLPALVEADKISNKAAALGFEWPDISGVIEKLQEEAAELAHARESADHDPVESEVGDLLFTLVNLARFLKVDPEQALRKTNAKFRARFGHVEREVAATGSTMLETPLNRLEEIWQQAKRVENAQPPT